MRGHLRGRKTVSNEYICICLADDPGSGIYLRVDESHGRHKESERVLGTIRSFKAL